MERANVSAQLRKFRTKIPPDVLSKYENPRPMLALR